LYAVKVNTPHQVQHHAQHVQQVITVQLKPQLIQLNLQTHVLQVFTVLQAQTITQQIFTIDVQLENIALQGLQLKLHVLLEL
jgi:translation initiation factor RLI1